MHLSGENVSALLKSFHRIVPINKSETWEWNCFIKETGYVHHGRAWEAVLVCACSGSNSASEGWIASELPSRWFQCPLSSSHLDTTLSETLFPSWSISAIFYLLQSLPSGLKLKYLLSTNRHALLKGKESSAGFNFKCDHHGTGTQC